MIGTVLCVAGCSEQRPPPAPCGVGAFLGATATSSAVAARLCTGFELTMARGSCLGQCPVYEVRISSSGKVHFVGRHHVGADRAEGLIEPERACEIYRATTVLIAAAARRVRAGEAVCSESWTDHPQVRLSYRSADAEMGLSIDPGCKGSPTVEAGLALAAVIDEEVQTRTHLRLP